MYFPLSHTQPPSPFDPDPFHFSLHPSPRRLLNTYAYRLGEGQPQFLNLDCANIGRRPINHRIGLSPSRIFAINFIAVRMLAINGRFNSHVTLRCLSSFHHPVDKIASTPLSYPPTSPLDHHAFRRSWSMDKRLHLQGLGVLHNQACEPRIIKIWTRGPIWKHSTPTLTKYPAMHCVTLLLL